MAGEMVCVYRTASVSQADLAVTWLEERGIAAEVNDGQAASSVDALAMAAPRGWAVCVLDAKDAEPAAALLHELFEEAAAKARAEDEAGRVITGECEDCGKVGTFPYSQRGSVQYCPHCHAHMDVPEDEGEA